MKVKATKIVCLVMMIFSLFFVNQYCFADTLSGSKIIVDAQNFIDKGKSQEKITEDNAIEKVIPLGRILVTVATVVVVGVGMVLGVKYMISGADEKANLKEKLIWYVISIVLIFGAVGIYNIISGILNEVV